VGEAKHIKEDSHCLHPTTAYNPYTSLSDDEIIDHLQGVATDSTSKPPATFVSDVVTIPRLLQLLDHVVKQQYEIKELTGNQVRVQPITPDSYRAIIRALAEEKMHSIFTNLNMNAITG
jgi:hypothetical protein